MPRKASLPALRRHIDRIDDALLRLLNRRARLALAIAGHKARTNSDVYAADREKGVLARLARENQGPLPDRHVRSIFREIISASRALQRQLRIAYLGPEATFTHLAARRLFGAAAEYVPAGTVAEVFHDVETGRAALGVVPVENSTEGMVAHTLDLLVDSTLRVGAEIYLPVLHCLLARPGTRRDAVRRIVAHPQALGQCRQWLAAHLPGVPTEPETSNARAAERARQGRGLAAIAAEAAADSYGLAILARAIQDDPANVTRFLVLAPHDSPEPSGDDKTSIMFQVKHEAGALAAALRPFAAHGVNMLKLESRPQRGRPWDYSFFVDLVGHRRDRPIARALAELGRTAVHLKILGSYPAAPPAEA